MRLGWCLLRHQRADAHAGPVHNYAQQAEDEREDAPTTLVPAAPFSALGNPLRQVVEAQDYKRNQQQPNQVHRFHYLPAFAARTLAPVGAYFCVPCPPVWNGRQGSDKLPSCSSFGWGGEAFFTAGRP